MAHPFASMRGSDKEKAKSMTKGYKIGGAVGKAATSNVAKYANGGKAGGSDLKAVGRASGGRLDKFARGGRSKGKGGKKTNINIVVAPKGPHPAEGAAPPILPPGGGGLPPPPMAGPPPGLGAGPPPGAGGPPGLPPGLGKPPGMMKRGGAVKKFARGGRFTGGAETGVGRLEKARKAK